MGAYSLLYVSFCLLCSSQRLPYTAFAIVYIAALLEVCEKLLPRGLVIWLIE